MYHFRYYAIGHSYLRHGPFFGWQTEGFWGMAASDANHDYFHRFQDRLREKFDCEIEAIAENHASFERRCVQDATRADYETSPEYAHIKEVLQTFKPNIISVMIGDGNVIAKDEASIERFYDVLYGMIASYKREDAVVVCPTMRRQNVEINARMAKKHGLTPVDVSFLHATRGYENPYHAFRDYPDYDARAALGAVEFRTHPSNAGHDAIAATMANACFADIPFKIAQGTFSESYRFAEFVTVEALPKLEISTSPQMYVQFHGFNLRREGDCVVFGSAPETGASILVEQLFLPQIYQRLAITLSVESPEANGDLELTVKTDRGELQLQMPITPNRMHRYEFDLAGAEGIIRSFRITPVLSDCVLTVRSITLE